MRAGPTQGELPPALEHPADGGQQQGAAGHRLAGARRSDTADKEAPPVVHPGHRAGRHLAAQPIVGREAAQPHWFFNSS